MTVRTVLRPTTLVAAIALGASALGVSAMGAPALASGAVMRHLKLVRTFPKADTVLVASPDRIAVELSESVELTGSKLSLAKDGGAPVVLGALRREPAAPKVLRADVATPLAAGGYSVSWRTMSKDGHVVKGTFQFRVAK